MKSIIIPAQVTTVEDKIIGNIGMLQLTLIFAPMMLGGLLYAGLTPRLHFAIYKIFIMIVLETIGAISAIRVKDHILLIWATYIASYLLRPRLYLYTTPAAPQDDKTVIGTETSSSIARSHAVAAGRPAQQPFAVITPEERIAVSEYLSNSDIEILFKTTKQGGSYVAFSEASK
jgi:hypothetical protein